jgi:hypothetical protein
MASKKTAFLAGFYVLILQSVIKKSKKSSLSLSKGYISGSPSTSAEPSLREDFFLING